MKQLTDIPHLSSEFISREDYALQQSLGLRKLTPSTYPWNFNFSEVSKEIPETSKTLVIKLLATTKVLDVPSGTIYNIYADDCFVKAGFLNNKHKPASLCYQTILVNLVEQLKDVSVEDVTFEFYNALGWVCHTRQALMIRHDSELKKLLKSLKAENPRIKNLKLIFRHNPDAVKVGYASVVQCTRDATKSDLLYDCKQFFRDVLMAELDSRQKFSRLNLQ